MSDPLPPPPPLTLPLPTLSDSPYSFYMKRKQQMQTNGEQQYSDSSQEIQAKMKDTVLKLQQTARQCESNGEGPLINITTLGYCPRCDRWLNKSSLDSHQLCHAAIIFDNLLLGDKFSSQNPKQLIQRMKVTHVVNAAFELPNFLQKQGLIYLQLNLNDDMSEELISQIQRAFKFISIKEQAHEKGGIVFVHCAIGKSRSVSVILAYLLLEKGIGIQEGLKYVQSKRSIAKPNLSYMRQLLEYEEKVMNLKGIQKIVKKCEMDLK